MNIYKTHIKFCFGSLLLYIFSCFIILLTSCNSPKKLLQIGEYDLAIQKSLPSVVKSKVAKSEKKWEILKSAYRLAYHKDIDALLFYRTQLAKNPYFCINIFDTYELLYLRDSTLKDLPLSKQKELAPEGFPDYTKELESARLKAAAYTYAKASLVLNQAIEVYTTAQTTETDLSYSRLLAREAYNDLVSLQHYYTSYKDSDSLLSVAKRISTIRIGILVEGSPKVEIPDYLQTNLILEYSKSFIKNEWISIEEYDNQCDYLYRIVCTEAYLTPIYRHKSSQIVRDSIEKIIRINDSTSVTVKEEVVCRLIANEETCSYRVKADIYFYEHYLKDTYIPITEHTIDGESVYRYIWFESYGDERALDSEQLRAIYNIPVYYPPDPIILKRNAYKDLVSSSDSFLRGFVKKYIK